MGENTNKKIVTLIKDPDDESKQLDYSFDIYDPKNYDVDEAEAAPAGERKLKVSFAARTRLFSSVRRIPAIFDSRPTFCASRTRRTSTTSFRPCGRTSKRI